MNIRSSYLNNFQNNILNNSLNKIENKTLQLSTGNRINSASDDTASLQISTRLTSQIRGTNKSIQNIKDGISVLQTAESTLGQIQQMIQRLNELAIQGKNGTYSSEQKLTIESEMKEVIKGINDIANSSTFNNIPLLKGGAATSVSGVSSENQRVRIDNIPVNTTPNAKTTVEFWMNWDGNQSSMPVAWNGAYDIYLASNSIGINTGQSNILGVSSAGLENKWTHIAVVFTNGVPSPSNTELYIDGEKQSLSERRPASPTTAYRAVTPTIHIGSPNSSYDWGGQIDELKVWNGTRTEDEIKADMYSSNTGNEENLLGYWKFDDETLKDETSNGNSGQFINGALLGEGVSKSIGIHSGYQSENEDNVSLFSISEDILGIENLSLNDPDLLSKIQSSLNAVSQQRSQLGSKINQYEYKLDYQTNSELQHQQTRQTIKEVDMSSTQSSLTKEEIKVSTVQKIMSMNWSFQEQQMNMLMS